MNTFNQKSLYTSPAGNGAEPIKLVATGYKQLADIPGYGICCVVGCDNPASRAVTIVDGRSGTHGSICFEHQNIDPNFSRTEWPDLRQGLVA